MLNPQLGESVLEELGATIHRVAVGHQPLDRHCMLLKKPMDLSEEAGGRGRFLVRPYLGHRDASAIINGDMEVAMERLAIDVYPGWAQTLSKRWGLLESGLFSLTAEWSQAVTATLLPPCIGRDLIYFRN